MFLATIFEAIAQSKAKEQEKEIRGHVQVLGARSYIMTSFPVAPGTVYLLVTGVRQYLTGVRQYRIYSGGQQGLVMHDPST